MTTQATCPNCGYTWDNQVPYPRKCPDCQRRWPLGRPQQPRQQQDAPTQGQKGD
ncbi:MAG: hypothetical protein Q8R28_18155 [Dehalococcoidia bacterium]|nr:hypothetical protein [Dehalococcoidia bacterium]